MTFRTRILPGRSAFMLLFAALFAIAGMLAGARRHAFADGGGGPAALKRLPRSIPALPLGTNVPGAQTAARGRQSQQSSIRPRAASFSGTPVQVSFLPGPGSEIAMDVDPSDRSHVVVATNHLDFPTLAPMDIFYSTDGGKSFKYSGQPPNVIAGTQYLWGGDPDIKWDTQGNVYASFLVIDVFTDNDALGVSRSTDNGKTWSPINVLVGFDPNLFSDKEFMGVDTSPTSPNKDNVYISWTNFTATDARINFARSTDNGQTFSPPIAISPPNSVTQFSDIATAADGTVAVVWWNATGFNNQFLLGNFQVAISKDGGKTFGAPQLVVGSDNTPVGWTPFCAPDRGIICEPTIRFDNSTGPYAGRMYVSWTAPLGGNPDNANVFIDTSDDLGATWTDASIVNDDNSSTSHFHSWLSVDPLDGRVAVTYYSCQGDSANARAQVVLALSSDGGRSFATHLLSTTRADESCYDPNRNFNNYGEYSQSVALGGKNYVTWTQTQLPKPFVGVEHPFFELVDVTGSSGTINVVAPNGGERLSVGQNTTLRWDTQGVGGNVKIELSRNGGGSWETLFPIAPNNRFIGWTVTGPPTTQARLRITSIVNPAITSTSIDNFTIVQPALGIDAPVGGEDWPLGFIRRMSWHSTDLDGDIMVELSRDGGGTWETAIADTANTGIFDWKVTGPATDQALVRVSSVNIPSLQSVSPAVFTIEAPSIAVTAPNGGESLSTGSTATITWTSKAVSGQVAIDLSRDNGGLWSNLFSGVDVNAASQDWTVTGPATDKALIRVRSLSMGTSDASDATFSITAQALSLVAPRGGEHYQAGTTQKILWKSTRLKGTVSIDLSRDAGKSWSRIANGLANTGTYSWQVSAPLTATARVRVCSDSISTCEDASKANFSIDSQAGGPPPGGGVTVLSPAGGEKWKIGSMQAITWSAPGLNGGSVKIELSTNAGGSWQPVFASVPNSGSQTWKVSGAASSRCLVRITSTSNPQVTGTSKATFTITH